MLRDSQRRTLTIAIILLSLTAGLVLLVVPVSEEETGPVYSASLTATEIVVPVGYAPPSYFTTARVTSGNEVTVTLSVLLASSYTVIFSANFQPGTFEVSKISVGNGGTV